MSTSNHFDFQETHRKLAEMLVEKTLKKHGVMLDPTNISAKERQTILQTVQQLQAQAQRFLDNIPLENISDIGNALTEIIPSTSQTTNQTPSADTVENKATYSRFSSPNNINSTKLFFKKKK